MIIEINNERLLKDIQHEFSLKYPYLKIEFFKKPHHWQEYSKEANKCDQDKKIGAVRHSKARAAFLKIHPWDRTGDVEKQFHDLFDLQVQIYRKEDDHWIQTAGTDELSLDEQNELGQTSFEHYQHGGDTWIEKEKLL